MKVSAVVVTYNRLNLLKQCLQHLLNQNYNLNNIVVVNNNSSDGTKQYLFNLSSKNHTIVPVNSTKNLGGAGGFSIGTKYAYEHTDSQYFWLMDDDTMPTKSALDKIVQKAKMLNYNFGFLCSNVRWWKDKHVALTNIPHPAKDWNQPFITNLIKVDSTSFVSVLFSRKSVSKLGLPISDMFIWGDDVEFTTRLSKNNPRSYLVTDSVVLHKSSENVSYNIVNSPRITFYKYGIRNKIYIRRKYDNIRHLIKQLLSYVFTMCRIPFCAKNKRCKRMWYIIVGIFTGFFFNPTVRFPKQ